MKIGPPLTYFDGQVQSLAFVEEGIVTMTIGMVLPGQYSFGEAKREELIMVTTGALTINGQKYVPESAEGHKPCVIHPGTKIVISATEESTYICRYPNAR